MKLLKRTLTLFLCAIVGSSAIAQNVESKIDRYFKQHATELALAEGESIEWRISNQHSSSQFDVSYIYVQQQYEGVDIHNAISTFAYSNNELFLTGNRLLTGVESRINTTEAMISKEEAIQEAALQLGIVDSKAFKITFLSDEDGKSTFEATEISNTKIPVRLMYAHGANNELILAWDLSIDATNGDHWWSVRVNALTGELINKIDWVVSCTFGEAHDLHSHNFTQPTSEVTLMLPPPPSTDQYNVFALPAESPNHAPRSIVVGPSDVTASPYGWHDTDGNAGEEYTITRGNNVYASEDTNDDDVPGYSPDGGASLNFDFPLNLLQPGSGFWDPAITNLFYMNNIMHDVWYHYGFDEAGGNFQENNYGNGGAAQDYVNADAQDGSGTNNANFATPPDGSNPRMQMYLWGGGGTPTPLQINSPANLAGLYIGVEGNIALGVPASPITADFEIFEDGTPDTYDACEPAVNAPDLAGKIVVIRRGGCTYVDKIVAAEAAGAVAVIIVNNVGGSPEVMGGTDPGIGIPAIMVTQFDGEQIITGIENGTVNGALGDFGPYPADSDFDNGIISHEYGHGISNRLTGGASSADCLWNAEQMGEGWSDWFGLMLTIEPGDQGTDVRGIGTYPTGEPITGQGIRPAPYSTDWGINNYTYGSTNSLSLSEPHGIGFVWATMLWDLTWKLIDVHGYDADLYNGTGGNNIAMHLVMNGLKLQPCNPGFVDGRDAILQADQMLYNGEHECLIWEVFANRGLGYSADQGSSFDREDQTAAFDLPPGIDHVSNITTCGSYTWPLNGQTYTTSGTYTAPITPSMVCDSVATLNLTINSFIVPSVSYIDGVTLQANNQNVDGLQWLNCGDNFSVIPGETNAILNAPANGTYAVEVTQGECVDTSVCFLVNSVSVDELVGAAQITLMPNPTEGQVNIHLGGIEYQNVQVKVTNALGQLVSTSAHEHVTELEIFLEGDKGVYFVELNADGVLSSMIRVVKE